MELQSYLPRWVRYQPSQLSKPNYGLRVLDLKALSFLEYGVLFMVVYVTVPGVCRYFNRASVLRLCERHSPQTTISTSLTVVCHNIAFL